MAAGFILAQSWWTHQVMVGMRRYSDEVHHVKQITWFCDGRREMVNTVTMFPTYHAAAAAMAKWTGDCSREGMRRSTTLWGVLAWLAAGGILLVTRSQHVAARLLGFAFLPLVYPYVFLVYTDVAALAVALLSTWLLVGRHWVTASLVAVLSVALRQTNVVMLAFVALVAWVEEDKSRPFRTCAWTYLKKVWPCALGALAFAVFVYKNKGVALGDQAYHQTGIHVGNVYFALFLLCWMALPVFVENIWRRRGALQAPWFWLGLAAAYGVFMSWFEVNHPYNTHEPFLRNSLLAVVATNHLTKSVFFVPVAVALAGLYCSPLLRRSFLVLAPIAVLMLLPDNLIEQRYGMLPIALWVLLRADASGKAEAATAMLNIFLCTLLLAVITTTEWFM